MGSAVDCVRKRCRDALDYAIWCSKYVFVFRKTTRRDDVTLRLQRVVFRLHPPYLGTIGQEQTYSSASSSASASCVLVFLTVDLKAVPNQHLLQ